MICLSLQNVQLGILNCEDYSLSDWFVDVVLGDFFDDDLVGDVMQLFVVLFVVGDDVLCIVEVLLLFVGEWFDKVFV